MVEKSEETATGEPRHSFFSRFAGESWEIIKILAISLAIVLPIRYFVAQPFVVRGSSMIPNFEDREYLVIDELSYFLRPPHRGEVIVFHYPLDTRQFFIKRVIGLPGDKIEIKDGRVHIINPHYSAGFTLEETYLSPPNHPTYPSLSRTLESDEYFVLGDNRDASSDSRVWGTLRRNLIVGRVLFRAWPPVRFGLVPNFSVNY